MVFAVIVVLYFEFARSFCLCGHHSGSITVSGYTNPEIDGVASATLYAGFADTGNLCATGDGENPCDSFSTLSVTACSGAAGVACNKTNVYGACH